MIDAQGAELCIALVRLLASCSHETHEEKGALVCPRCGAAIGVHGLRPRGFDTDPPVGWVRTQLGQAAERIVKEYDR